MIGVPAVWLQLASATHAPRWRATLTDAAGYPLVADHEIGRASCRERV